MEGQQVCSPGMCSVEAVVLAVISGGSGAGCARWWSGAGCAQWRRQWCWLCSVEAVVLAVLSGGSGAGCAQWRRQWCWLCSVEEAVVLVVQWGLQVEGVVADAEEAVPVA
jgi:hypothetical protein